MTSAKGTSERRASLFPPRMNTGSPNDPMVLAASVPISLIKHNRQRDQETEPTEERIGHINQQRHSLAQAIDVINTWKQRDSINTPNYTNQSISKTESSNATQHSQLLNCQSTNPPLDRHENKSMTNYFYKRP